MRFGEKLIQAGIIDRAQLGGALRHQEQTGQRLGESLLELGYISEQDLLHHLAKEFNTRYVSSKKLAGIVVDPALLELIPVKLAEAHQVFPILLNRESNQLGVISCEPQGFEGLEETRIISGMDTIRVYVAQRDAIRALIKKHYRGDIHAFDMLDKEKQNKFDETMEMFIDPSLEEAIQVEDRAEPLSSGPAVSKSQDTSQVTSSWTRAIEAVREGSLVSDNDFIETLNILVGLIEMQIENRQGHSARVAKAVKHVSERIGLKEHQIHYNIIAAYLHELGKRASSHLTLMSIAINPECRQLAERYCLTPSRLFDAVHLPARVNHILTHLYENYGGTGLPEQLYGEGIPLGARIISAVDAYEDLLNNPGNFFGECLDPEQALTAVKKKVGTLFDGRVVKVMEELVAGEAAAAPPKETTIAKPPPPEPEAPAQAVLTLDGSEDTSEISGVVIEVETESEPEVEREESLPTPSSASFAGVDSKGKALSGSLENKTALSLIRSLVARKRSGHLGLRAGELKGEILFENGRVFGAFLGESEGEEAFLELASWKGCLYRFDTSKTPTARSIKTPTAKLLQIAKLSME